MIGFQELTRRQIYILSAALSAVLLIAMVATFRSCRPHTYPAELVAADSLCDSNADSALVVLQTLPGRVDTTVDANRWYVRLLRVKARYKMYIKSADTSEAQSIVDYYESFGSDKRLLPYAYYYLGGAYRDQSNYPMAIEFYHKALNIADRKNLAFCSALNFQIGFLMYEQMLGRKALPYLSASYKLEEEKRDTVMMTYVLQKMAYVYMDEKSDSCLVYFNKAAGLAKSVDEKLYNVVLSSLATYYLYKGDYRKAKACALPGLSLKSQNVQTMASYLDVVAHSYYGLGNLDSAAYYFHRMDELDYFQGKLLSNRFLARIYREKEDMDKAFRYFDKYTVYEDSMQRINATETVAKLDAAYNYTSYKEKNMSLERRNTYMLYILTVAFFITAFCVTLLVVWHRRNQRLAKEQELRLQKFKRESQERSEGYIRECEARIKTLEEQLAASDVEDMETIKSEYDNIANLYGIAKRRIAIQQDAMTRLKSTPIYSAIEKKAISKTPLSEDDFFALDESVAGFFPEFKQSLYTVCPLSVQDYHLCLLIKAFSFSDYTSSALLSRSRSTISKARKKLKTKYLGSETEICEFDKFIKEL